MTSVFAQHAEAWHAKGFWARPIEPGTKACRVKGWQKPDSELPPAELKRWLTAYSTHGIGLLMGSPFPDGTRLGAIDVDRNEYTRLARELLRHTPTGRFGSKGAVFFVRVKGDLGNPKFRVKGAMADVWGQVVECLFVRTLCVIPPTIHPDTKSSYRWIGEPLDQISFQDLPLIEK